MNNYSFNYNGTSLNSPKTALNKFEADNVYSGLCPPQFAVQLYAVSTAIYVVFTGPPPKRW
jgi:hypothetical protein